MQLIIRKILNRLENYISFDSFIILEARINDQIKDEQGTVEKITSSAEIEAVYRGAGRQNLALKQTIENRISQGLDFYSYSIDSEIVAFTWLLDNVPRFIDEVGMSLGPKPNSLWVRDIYVLENQRGKNIFSKFLSLIIGKFYQGNINSFYSDILQSNQSSFQAHKNYGFKPLYKINFCIIFNRLLIRSLPDTEMEISVYKEEQSIISIDDSFKQHVKNNMA